MWHVGELLKYYINVLSDGDGCHSRYTKMLHRIYTVTGVGMCNYVVARKLKSKILHTIG